MTALIEAHELHDLLQEPQAQEEIRILDSTCNTVTLGLTPFQAYQAKHIAHAVHFDIDDVADPDAPLPHTVPNTETFERKVTDLGIGNNHKVIVYDQSGMAFAAARVWWLFRLFGHDNVQILNGGLPAWDAHKFATSQGTESTQAPPTPFQGNLRKHMVKFMGDVLDETKSEECVILDARAPERFSGAVKESRGYVESGHIPSSKNVFFKDLIDSDTGKLKPRAELEIHLAPYKEHRTVTCSCGGGVTACIIALGLYVIGNENASIYDGSWAEWGNKANQMPIHKTV